MQNRVNQIILAKFQGSFLVVGGLNRFMEFRESNVCEPCPSQLFKLRELAVVTQ
jgi:hypothetical protein